jgi:hypothetical protein
MISNERSFPFRHPQAGPCRIPVAEETLRSEKIQIERKTFVLALKENPRGRFLRITEDAGARHSTLIIPTAGLEDFRRVVEQLARVAAQLPPKSS